MNKGYIRRKNRYFKKEYTKRLEKYLEETPKEEICNIIIKNMKNIKGIKDE